MRAVLAGVLAALIVACGGSDVLTDLEVCNQNLSWVPVAVSNDQGKPLDGLSHRTVLVETGTRVVLDSILVSHWRFGATYPVISDREKRLLSEDGDELRFVAWDANWVAIATFVVGSDGCHIVKRSGPDTIVAF